MKITFRQIDAFRTVVSTGTVTESAQMLGISQPAVSRLISELESQVSFKLFTRSGRNLKPTLEARLLVEEVRRALSGLERIKEAARAIQQFKHAQLRLITTPTFATVLAPQLVAAFAERRPEVMISLEIQSSDDTIEWMVSQNHDFGIAPPTGKNPVIMSLPLVKTEAVCILPPKHRLAGKQRVTPEDLAGESFISYLSDSTFRFEIDEIFRKANVERRLQYEARTTDAICRLVSEGLGVSIVGSVHDGKNDAPGYSAAPFTPGIPFGAALIWSRRNTMSAVAEDFLSMIETDINAR
jgi:DNA-binding transcriptional LysR family regulator